MTRSEVKTFRFRVGKKHVLVVKIVQTATAKAKSGNVLASNAANVRIFKKNKKRHH